ncbi:MAG: hypothetical protein ABI643_03860 [Candidatus Doudnabacteria bacterium]
MIIFKHFVKTNWVIILAVIILIAGGFKFIYDQNIYGSGLSHDPRDTNSQAATAAKINQYCSDPVNIAKDLGKESCYAKQFKQLAAQVGPKESFAVLRTLQTIDRSAVGCHLISHGIGWGTFDHDPNSWQQDIRSIDPSCNYGGPHGIIEAYLASQPDHSLTKDKLPQFCGTEPRADCNHIIGHLTLVETRGNISQALALCDAFKGNPTQLDFCYTGVFMEDETALNLVEHGFADKSWLNWPARLPELTKMCLTYKAEAGEACWTELVHVIASTYKNDPKRVFDYCSRNPIQASAARCKRHGIGIMAAGHNFDIASMRKMCDLKQANDINFKSDCYVQLVSSNLSTIPGDKQKAQTFCESLESQYQRACLNQVSYDHYIQDIGAD